MGKVASSHSEARLGTPSVEPNPDAGYVDFIYTEPADRFFTGVEVDATTSTDLENWAATLPANPEDEYHPVEQTYSSWHQADPDAAGAWLETIGDSTPWAARLRGGKER